MSFVYFTKEKTVTSEQKLNKDKIREIFKGTIVIRKTRWHYAYRKSHSKDKATKLKYKWPKSKIIGIIKV